VTADAVIDAALFLGMHCRDDSIRVACKNFFVDHLHEPVVMNLEQVGRCDDLVWAYPREAQDAYYPFMDNLHSDMKITRVPYERSDLDAGLALPDLTGLRTTDRMLLGMVLRRNAILHTVSPRLLAHRADYPMRTVTAGGERSFPGRLEELYRESLALRVPIEHL
jgi:hypothetical protein